MKLKPKDIFILAILFVAVFIALAIFSYPNLTTRPFTTENIIDVTTIGFSESIKNPVYLVAIAVVVYFLIKKS